MLKESYIKLIFGLKVKQLRSDRKMSLTELAARSGMSVSYLNEIESGKKYPKTDKIASLSESLGTTYDKLVSLRLAKSLAPIGELLESNILEKLPLDHYGIDINKLIQLMADSSIQLSALIATFIEMAETSELSQNNFSKTALRIFKEFGENYFEDIEAAAEIFSGQYKLRTSRKISLDKLKEILIKFYNYQIDETTLSSNPLLSEFRAVLFNKNRPVLLLNNRLSEAQKAFIVGKELAYCFFDIKERSNVHSGIKLKTFDQLLNNFKASYFSTAILINQKFFATDLAQIFKSNKWDGKLFLNTLEKYNCTTEMFFQRITNLSSKYFGINKIFFFRFNHEIGSAEYRLSNELRLNTRRNPGGSLGTEHFCRRWVSFKTLAMLESIIKKDKNFSGRTANICHSKFYDSQDEYICISVGQRGNLLNNTISSITVGFQIDDALRNKINFLNDTNIPFIIVNEACERCTIPNCKERLAPPVTSEKLEKSEKVEEALRKLESELNN